MPLDALCLSGVIHELNTSLAGARVDKIYQPGRDEVVLALRTQSVGNVRLLLSANPAHPRLHLTTLPLENPEKPPMFCMLLRKHLSGARLLELVQPPLERAAVLRFEALNELGDRVERRLVLEAISHKTNLVLLDGDGRILDCIRHTGGDVTTGRILQPGMFYRLPPGVDKENPLTADRERLESLLSAAPEEAQSDKWLLDTFGGLSPLICRELVHQAAGATDARLHTLGTQGQARLLDRLEGLKEIVTSGQYTPTMISLEGHPKDFTFLPVGQYEGAAQVEDWPAFSPLLDAFFEQRERQDRIKQRGQDLIKSVTNARDRTARKLANQEKELARRRAQMQRDYPEIISKLTLLLGAGMTVKRAWRKIVMDYEEEKDIWGIRYAYEEMRQGCNEMESGITEAESYERFGRRCGMQIYVKLGALLSQNLRKGAKGMNQILKTEASQAFEERKARARRLGEEAGTKLLAPMFLMLAVVLVIVIVPAFMSVQM